MIKKSSFYKYKSLNDLEFLLDALLRQRFYAANYSDINDPMEGSIKIESECSRDLEFAWEGYIKRIGVVCFTKDPDASLMWSHYADGRKGCVIGFELIDNQPFSKVSYMNKPKLRVDNFSMEMALEQLKFKAKHWSYENEYRCLVIDRKFLPVNIVSVTFGSRADSSKVDLIEHIITQCNPSIRVLREAPSGAVVKPKILMGKAGVFQRASDEAVCEKCLNKEINQNFYHEKYRKL
ncbi:DUF2971 domain-containing protein [Serpens gallinarum]|uniref:DUF2971 domain-containing protein n=1 Tax=Serpens gallinarum TaxID=2763075 RepID=A0ABR8TTF7_9PSED|nr:DUF2971 domain-containing protein [Serpens gallinarum]MBD7978889.1 DUF2971 domain-containing protein [Serpens gallinarum]